MDFLRHNKVILVCCLIAAIGLLAFRSSLVPVLALFTLLILLIVRVLAIEMTRLQNIVINGFALSLIVLATLILIFIKL